MVERLAPSKEDFNDEEVVEIERGGKEEGRDSEENEGDTGG